MDDANTQENTKEPKKLLGQSVEESRVKRVEKQNARYRDRGGIFVPSDTNPLLDMLLARGVNGESPSKKRTSAPTSHTDSPRKKLKRGNRSPAKTTRTVDKPTTAGATNSQEAANKSISGKSKASKLSKKVENTKLNEGVNDAKPIPGPSRQKRNAARKTKSATRRSKDETAGSELPQEHEVDDAPPNTFKSREAPNSRSKSTPAFEYGMQNVPKQSPRFVDPDDELAKSSKRKGKRAEVGLDDDAGDSNSLVADKKRKPSAARKGPTSRLASKSRKNVRAKVSDVDRVTTVDRTGKRKGRLKQNSADDLKPVYQDELSRTVRKETTTDTNEKRTKSSATRKRRASVCDIDERTPGSSDIPPPPLRKRPKLPIPSDSEDDLPLVIKRQASRTVPNSATTVPVDRPSVATRHSERPPPTSDNTKTSSRTIPKRKTDTAIAELPHESDATSIQVSREDRLEGGGDSTQQSTSDRQLTQAITTHDHPTDVSGKVSDLVAAQAKNDTEEGDKQLVKRNKNRATATSRKPSKSSSRAHDPAKETPDDKLNAKKAVDGALLKRLKTLSRGQKENRDTSKKAAVVRKPKPRLSMFPTPAMAADSEDELDLLN